jgi:hypothetical protein
MRRLKAVEGCARLRHVEGKDIRNGQKIHSAQNKIDEDKQNEIIQLLCFCILSIVLILFKTTFRRLDFVPVFRGNLLSWAQSIELVPIFGRDKVFG